MYSNESSGRLREIWLVSACGREEWVRECGLCEPDAAERQAAALLAWLRDGRFDHRVLDRDLLSLPQSLRDDGIDPAGCELLVVDPNAIGACGAAAALCRRG